MIVYRNKKISSIYTRGNGEIGGDVTYLKDYISLPQKLNNYNNLVVRGEFVVKKTIFKQKYSFNGLPKIHEHDGKRAQAFGLFSNGRLVCLYTYETDLSDGWEDQSVHNDPNNKRQEALQMGANIISYAFNN